MVKSQGGKFGARDLRRVIRKAVEDPAAEKIIDGTLASGSTLTVDAENDEIVLKYKHEPPCSFERCTAAFVFVCKFWREAAAQSCSPV